MDDRATVTAADELLSGLTEPQKRAVTHVDGPLLVLAGAGSGKTRVITRRIAYLVKAVGIAPWNVLAITFTNKAAGEMRERVAALLSDRQARAVTVCTFHSLCARLLRQFADRVDLTPGYSIYDTADQQRLMKKVLEELEVSATNFPPGKALATISHAKNELIDPRKFAAGANGFYDKQLARIYQKYQDLLHRNNALDFDDLLLLTVELLHKHADVAATLREKYQYILIDEYQDTNHAQFVLANALAATHQNLCATGDPDQSIYGWRGANIRNILEFESHYPDATVVKLEQNYRSTRHILAAADKLIQHNRRRKHKSLWTENEAGDKVTVLTADDEQDEARAVVERFTLLHDREKIDWGDMAVFYRINSLSRVVEDAFRKAAIPYQVARGTAFYERKEIKDAIAYLRLIANPADTVNLLRVVNFPARGVSDATVKALTAHAVAAGVELGEVLRHPAQVAALNSRAVAAVQRFVQMLDEWGKLLRDPPADTSLRCFVEQVLRQSGLEEYYRHDKSDPDQERLANLGELVSSVQQFEDEPTPATPEGESPTLERKLQLYLEQVSLVSDVDSLTGEGGAVTLMTLHAAKGLEFAAVAMIGVEDGLLPHERSRGDDDQLEEERRLCFVGITRARRMLTLCRARHRTVFGQSMPTITSPFLNELPPEVIQKETTRSLVEGNDDEDDRDSAGNEFVAQFPQGCLVRHPRFGLGRIMRVTPAGGQTRASVLFNMTGHKTLILEYAHLERVR